MVLTLAPPGSVEVCCGGTNPGKEKPSEVSEAARHSGGF